MLCIYLKITNKCNLFCEHCYVPPIAKKQGDILTREILTALINGLKEIQEDDFRFIWHGGEPFLYGVSVVHDYSNFIAENLKGKNFSFEVQTNLIMDDQELFKLVDFLKVFTGGVVGTSYDFGIRRLNGSHELFMERWLKSVRFLRENGIFVNVVITLTKQIKVEELFTFIRRMMDSYEVISFHLERFTPSGTGSINKHKLYLNNSEFFHLFGEVLDRYISFLEKGEVFYLSPFEKMAREYFLGKGAGCFSGDCLSKILTLNPDGTISSCPDLAFYEEYIFGNILEKPLSTILASPQRIKSICRQVQFICSDCEYYSFCNGGCPHHYPGFDGVSCRRFFEKFVSVAGTILSALERLRKSKNYKTDETKLVK